jgi:hypothetical protein
LVKARDERVGVSTEQKRELRKGYLPSYETKPGADQWVNTGEAVVFEAVKKPLKK